MLGYIKRTIKKTPLLHLWISFRQYFAPPQSQSNESEILAQLVGRYRIPKLFIEFGFGAWQFNCAELTTDFDGLLMDGDSANVMYAKHVLPKGIQCEHVWLTLETLGIVERFAEGQDVGILSVDVDGNDFWFLRRLIDISPAIIVCEFNPAFGSQLISVPYDEDFQRFEKHPGGLYWGASIAAFHHLCSKHGYTLLAISSNGVNAFFVRNDLLLPDDVGLDLACYFRDASIRAAAAEFEEIADFDFIDVTKLEH